MLVRMSHLLSESLRAGLQQIRRRPYLASCFAPSDQTAWECSFHHHFWWEEMAAVSFLGWNFHSVSRIFLVRWWWWPLQIVWSMGSEKWLQKGGSFLNRWPACWPSSSSSSSSSSPSPSSSSSSCNIPPYSMPIYISDTFPLKDWLEEESRNPAGNLSLVNQCRLVLQQSATNDHLIVKMWKQGAMTI